MICREGRGQKIKTWVPGMASGNRTVSSDPWQSKASHGGQQRPARALVANGGQCSVTINH